MTSEAGYRSFRFPIVPNTHVYVRKNGKWMLAALHNQFPPPANDPANGLFRSRGNLGLLRGSASSLPRSHRTLRICVQPHSKIAKDATPQYDITFSQTNKDDC